MVVAEQSARTGDPRPTTIVVAVPTYRRPELLPALVEELQRQCRQLSHDRESFAASVLVIDNDLDQSGRAALSEAGLLVGDVAVLVLAEPDPGVVAVRNRALEECAPADALVFIDDDEKPCSNWLESLVDCWRRFDAAAVVGHVVPEYPAGTSRLVRDAGFFVRKSWPTGTIRPMAATNNLLLDLSAVRRAGDLRFDPAFARSGGEDSAFTSDLVAANVGPIVWCQEAWVTDLVPEGRTRLTWVLERQFSFGIRHGYWTQRDGDPKAQLPRVPGLRVAAAGIWRALRGLGGAVVGLLTLSPGRIGRGLGDLARGAGLLASLGGIELVQYGSGASAPFRSRLRRR